MMKLEGVFVLRFHLACLIALKFNIFISPLETCIVFFSHCPVKSSSGAIFVFVLQRLLCVLQQRDKSVALG